jgi:putative phosphoribosyl transferase
MARFADRTAAGVELGRLVALRGVEGSAVVLALPRGGVPVAVPVAAELGAPLDVLVVRKLRTPGQPELAFGAVASGGVRWLHTERRHLDPATIERLTAQERAEIDERESRYRPGREPIEITGRTAVLVDDGIATGATVRAAVEAARLRGAARVIVAAPVAPPDAVALLERVADRVDVVEVRRGFGAVSMLYDDFREVPDDAVAGMLADP